MSRAAREIIRCRAFLDYSATLATMRQWTSWRATDVQWIAEQEGVEVVWVALNTCGVDVCLNTTLLHPPLPPQATLGASSYPLLILLLHHLLAEDHPESLLEERGEG